jgi:hypothetical protein
MSLSLRKRMEVSQVKGLPMKNQHVRNIALDIILTIITCYIYNLYVQYKQMEAVNDMLKEEKYSFIFWLLFTILTCGFYHIYHEYRKSSDIARLRGKDEGTAGLTAVVLTLFGMFIICDAIQQSEINTYYGHQQL